MARTYDALIRAERIRQQGQETPADPDAELLERVASLEEGIRELRAQLPRDLTDAEERLMAQMGELIGGLEERRSRADRLLAAELESRIEPLQRRLTRLGLVLAGLLLWLLVRL